MLIVHGFPSHIAALRVSPEEEGKEEGELRPLMGCNGNTQRPAALLKVASCTDEEERTR